MAIDASLEPPIDTSLTHYLEERALAIALEKARSEQQRSSVERLAQARRTLLRQRESFAAEATAKRHARGEIYSPARVAAINAMGPSQADLDKTAKSLYESQLDPHGVLQAHARVHFGHGLVAARLMWSAASPDIVAAALEMQRHEERFAAEWIEAAGDASFVAEMRQLQREALRNLRTASRPIYLATHPESAELDDASAAALGKAWSKLDALAEAARVEPPSAFLALQDEPAAAGAAARDVLATIEALIAALDDRAQKLPGKRAVQTALVHARDALRALPADGRAHFEIDL